MGPSERRRTEERGSERDKEPSRENGTEHDRERERERERGGERGREGERASGESDREIPTKMLKRATHHQAYPSRANMKIPLTRYERYSS